MVGLAAGVDVGIANVTVQSYFGVGSDIWANGSVELNALASKDIQTYALSVGGGFVGVAGAVSVWTVGAAPTKTYQQNDQGPQRGAWSGGTRYLAGDVVTFNGQTYGARKGDSTGVNNTGHAPTDNEWWALSDQDPTTGARPGSADTIASGGSGGSSGGWGSVLSGAATVPTWTSGTTYHQGDLVLVRRPLLRGPARDPLETVSPPPDPANWQLNDDNVFAGASQQTANAQSSVTAAKPTGAVASTPFTQPAPPNGTSATVYGSVHAGQDAQIRAVDLLGMVSVAGVAAVGIGAIGAGVGVVNLGLTTDAGIASTGRVSAGGTVGVHATLTETFFGLAAAGALGGLAISGQVMVLTDTSGQRAHIDDGAAVPRAGTLLDVDATSTKTVARADLRRQHRGRRGRCRGDRGQGQRRHHRLHRQRRDRRRGRRSAASTWPRPTPSPRPTGPTRSRAASLGALSGAVAAVWYTGTTRAESGAHGTVVIGATGVTVTATGTRPAVNIDSLEHHDRRPGRRCDGRAGDAAAQHRGRHPRRRQCGHLRRGLGVPRAPPTAPWSRRRAAPSVGVAIALMFPYAEISGHTRVQVDGSVTASASVSMEAQASNAATATAIVASVGFAAGASGAYAQAVITSGADTTARVGSSASLTSPGAITLRAHGFGAEQQRHGLGEGRQPGAASSPARSWSRTRSSTPA